MQSLLHILKLKLNRSQNRERSENTSPDGEVASIPMGISTLLGLLVGVTPLLVDVRGYITFEPVKVLFVVGVVAALLPFLYYRFVRVGISLRRPFLIFGVIGGYIMSLILSWAFSIAPSVSFWGLEPRYHGFLLYMALMVVFFATLTLRRDLIERLLEVAMVGAVMVGLYGVLQRFFPALSQWWVINGFLGRIFSTLGQPNYLADYIVLVLPLFFWKYLVSRRWYLWLLLGSVPFLALLWTLSRSGFLGLLSAFLFFGIVYSLWGSHRKWIAGFLLVPIALSVLFLGVNIRAKVQGTGDSPTLISRLVLTGESARSLKSRSVIWSPTWKKILERPIFGYGLDTYTLAFAPATPKELLVSEDINSYADRAHNIILDTMMESGIVGLIAIVVCIGGSIFLAYRSRNIVALAMASALVGHTISQQFGFQVVTHMVLMWFFIGAILVMSGEVIETNRGVTKIKTSMTSMRNIMVIIIPTILISVGVGVFIYWYPYQTWWADRLARAGEYTPAYDLAPHRTRYGLEASAASGNLETLKAIQDFTNGADYQPFWYRARVYTQLENYDQAYVDFEYAIALAPMSLRVYLDYGRALFDGGEYDRAITIWQRYVDLAPEYWKEHEQYLQGKLSSWDKSRYEVFYKMNPLFDDVFKLISKAQEKLQRAR